MNEAPTPGEPPPVVAPAAGAVEPTPSVAPTAEPQAGGLPELTSPLQAPAIPEHPYTDALGRLQGVKGDEALLLQTGARLITDEIARLRAQAELDRAEIVNLRERAHAAEMNEGKVTERLRGMSASRRVRDGMFALGGVLGGAGVGAAQQAQASWFGVVVAVVGLSMILVAWLVDVQQERAR